MHYHCSSALCITLLTGPSATGGSGSAEPAGCHWAKATNGHRCYVRVNDTDMPASGVNHTQAAALCAGLYNGTLPALDTSDAAAEFRTYSDDVRNQVQRHITRWPADGRPKQGMPAAERHNWHFTDGTPVPSHMWHPNGQQPDNDTLCLVDDLDSDRLRPERCGELVYAVICEWRRAAASTTTTTTTTTTSSARTTTTGGGGGGGGGPQPPGPQPPGPQPPIVRTTSPHDRRRPPPPPQPTPAPGTVATSSPAGDESDTSTPSAAGGHNGYALLPLLAALAAAAAFSLA